MIAAPAAIIVALAARHLRAQRIQRWPSASTHTSDSSLAENSATDCRFGWPPTQSGSLERPEAGRSDASVFVKREVSSPGRPTLFFAQDKQDRPSGGANSRVRLPMQLCDEQPCGAPCVLPRSWRIARRETCLCGGTRARVAASLPGRVVL